MLARILPHRPRHGSLAAPLPHPGMDHLVHSPAMPSLLGRVDILQHSCVLFLV
jgi:hypothetical protein